MLSERRKKKKYKIKTKNSHDALHYIFNWLASWHIFVSQTERVLLNSGEEERTPRTLFSII